MFTTIKRRLLFLTFFSFTTELTSQSKRFTSEKKFFKLVGNQNENLALGNVFVYFSSVALFETSLQFLFFHYLSSLHSFHTSATLLRRIILQSAD